MLAEWCKAAGTILHSRKVHVVHPNRLHQLSSPTVLKDGKHDFVLGVRSSLRLK